MADMEVDLLPDSEGAESRKRLFVLMYHDLCSRAREILAKHRSPMLGATALVHETYLKLIAAPLAAQSKEHFFRVAAQAMRQIMVDRARHHLYQKRDERLQVSLDDELPFAQPSYLPDRIELNQALDLLHEDEPQLAMVVELHFFAGLCFAEIAKMRGVSLSTIERDWRAARSILHRRMS